MGRQRSPQHQDGDYMSPYLRAANVKDGQLELSSVLRMNFLPSEQLRFCLLRGDVLVTEGCGSLKQIGASAQWDGQTDGFVGFQNTLLRLRAINGLSDPEFVYQWARWSFDSGAFARVATGTSIFHIGATRAAAMPFPDWPIEKQRRTADLLRAVDRSIDLQGQRGAAAWRLLQCLTDAILNKPSWPMKRLDEVAQIGGGITKGRPSSGSREVPYLRVANVQHGRLDLAEIKLIEATLAEINRHALQPGDVLLLEGGNKEDVGRGWIWSGEIDECLHQNHLHRARPERALVDPIFLAYSICRSEARAYCFLNGKQTSNLATINRTQIAGLPVRIPSLEEQRRAVALLNAVRRDWQVAADAILVARSLRQSIRSALFSSDREISASYDRFIVASGSSTIPETVTA